MLDAGEELLRVVLVDPRLGSPTHGARNTMYVGGFRPWQVLIPPGVAHGYKVVGREEALLVYLTDRFYNPKDEGAFPTIRGSVTIGRRSTSSSATAIESEYP